MGIDKMDHRLKLMKYVAKCRHPGSGYAVKMSPKQNVMCEKWKMVMC